MPLVHRSRLILGLLLGSIVGLILGLSGAGGGVIAVPLLVFGLNLPVREAAPNRAASPSALPPGLATVLGLRKGIVRYRAAALVGVFGVLMAPAGRLARATHPERAADARLRAGPGLWSGMQTLRRTFSGREREKTRNFSAAANRVESRHTSGRFIWNLPCARMLSLTGLLSGLMSGLLGVGGGFVIIPALTRYSDLDQRRA
jgi:uncharacterized membrane protein YfcA